MKAPLYRSRLPQHTSAAVVHEIQRDRATAKTAPFAAVCWLCLIGIAVPFIPRIGYPLAALGAPLLPVIVFILALVLLVRGAVMRGLVSLLFGALTTFWLSGGAILAKLYAQKSGLIP